MRAAVGPKPLSIVYDWVGSAGLQEDIVDGLQLETIAGLPRDRWIVVGFRLYLRSSRVDADQLIVDAVDKAALGLTGTTDVLGAIADYAERHGAVPVHTVVVPDADARNVFAQMKHNQLHFLSSRLRDYPISALDQLGADTD